MATRTVRPIYSIYYRIANYMISAHRRKKVERLLALFLDQQDIYIFIHCIISQIYTREVSFLFSVAVIETSNLKLFFTEIKYHRSDYPLKRIIGYILWLLTSFYTNLTSSAIK